MFTTTSGNKEGSFEGTTQYWIPQGSNLPRPNPTISNCGLVIVQVDRNGEIAANRNEVIAWNSDTGGGGRTAAATHQLIHGLPPPTSANPMDEEIDEEVDEEDEEDFDEGNSSDEGYRTNSNGSPHSSFESDSPSPRSEHKTDKLSKKVTGKKIVHNRDIGEGEGNNLMWLLDFKLDFFNENQENINREQRGKVLFFIIFCFRKIPNFYFNKLIIILFINLYSTHSRN